MKQTITKGRVWAMILMLVLLLVIYLVFLYRLQIIQGEEYYHAADAISGEGTIWVWAQDADGDVNHFEVFKQFAWGNTAPHEHDGVHELLLIFVVGRFARIETRDVDDLRVGQ